MENKKEKAESYDELLASIRQLIEDAKAKGVPLFDRDDLLHCQHCGAYEDVLALSKDPSGKKRVFLNPKYEADREFIVINSRAGRVRAPKGKTRFRTTHWFICGVCGTHQQSSFTETFDDI